SKPVSERQTEAIVALSESEEHRAAQDLQVPPIRNGLDRSEGRARSPGPVAVQCASHLNLALDHRIRHAQEVLDRPPEAGVQSIDEIPTSPGERATDQSGFHFPRGVPEELVPGSDGGDPDRVETLELHFLDARVVANRTFQKDYLGA